MKKLFIASMLVAASAFVHAAGEAITVFKDPDCGCCEGWVKHLRESGFKVKTVDSTDSSAIKKRFGVPDKLASCHTGVVDSTGQVIEGHVPAVFVKLPVA